MPYTGSPRPSNPHAPRNRKPYNAENAPLKLQSNSASEIPFIDAHEDIGEIPLDQLDTFFIPSRDERGSFTRVTLQLPPYLVRQLQIIVRSQRFPYLEPSDVIRHAIYRHIGYCVKIRKSLPPNIPASLDAMMEICRDNDFKIRIHEAFREIERQVSLCLERGDTGEAVRLLNMVRKRLDGVPESEHQRKITEVIQQSYNYVMQSNGSLVKAEKKK